MPPIVIPLGSLATGTLNIEEAAAYIGFTVADFEKWVQLGLFPTADANTGGWSKKSLDKALVHLTHNGWPSHHNLPDIQRQPRTNSLGVTKRHHYRRDVHGALKGEPGSGVYIASLIEKNQHFARQGSLPNGRKPKKIAPRIAPATDPHKQSPTAQAPHRTSPPLAPTGQSQTEATPAPSAHTETKPSPVAQAKDSGAPAPPKLVTQKVASRTAGRPRTPAELVAKMQRRRAAVMQADIARIIRAAKQAGAAQVEVRLNDSSTVVVRLQPENSLASDEEIIL
jgi:hypothetical protein